MFADPEVKRVLLANGIGDGVGITKEAAAAVTSLGTAFKGNTEIEYFDEIRYFTGLTHIGGNAFNGCTALADFHFPENITTIGELAFKGSGLLNCNLLLTKVTKISSGAFNSTKLRSVVMPEIVSVGGDYNDDYTTFGLCPNIEYLFFGSKVNYISPYILKSSKKSVIMIVAATTPPTFGGDSFDYGGAPAAIYVPEASLEAYKTATNWSRYAVKLFSIERDMPTKHAEIYAEIEEYIGELPDLPPAHTCENVTSNYTLEKGQAYGTVGGTIQFTDDTAYEHTKANIDDVYYVMVKAPSEASSLVQYVDANDKILKIAVTNFPSLLTRYNIENIEGATHIYITSATGTLQIWKEIES